MPASRVPFWDLVDRSDASGCWPWRGPLANGYGAWRGRRAHRLALQFCGFEIPAGMLACHRCNNRACCHPGHLYVGTARDNAMDAVRAGRKNPTPHYDHNSSVGEGEQPWIDERFAVGVRVGGDSCPTCVGIGITCDACGGTGIESPGDSRFEFAMRKPSWFAAKGRRRGATP